MNSQPDSIRKNPDLRPAKDYYRLRKDGIGFIEQMGSQQWTDYNTHDPGITILEAFCYAITDLAFRTGKDIKDILTPALPPAGNDPFPGQAFFTARNILTINPLTPNDLRRILIDLEGVRNAWVLCKECACDTGYYAWCKDNRLNVSFEKPATPGDVTPVVPKGLYEVLLELDPDPELGDLNDHKIEKSIHVYDDAGAPHTLTIELHFPEWELDNSDDWQYFTRNDRIFNSLKESDFKVKLYQLGVSKNDTTSLSDSDLRRRWQNVFYAGISLITKNHNAIPIDNVTIRFTGDSTVRSKITAREIQNILESTDKTAIIRLYRTKVKKVAEIIKSTKELLHLNRNLGEDYCRVNEVRIEDIAVCADVEVAANADIELVQASIWYEIEKYLSPPVSFYSLREMMDSSVPVEDIFNGPELNNGFIKNDDLEKASLKKILRTSDILNLLMEIDGVDAVNNLMLTKYDASGQVVKDSADPVWIPDPSDPSKVIPDFGAKKTSASWLMYITDLHQPRLYRNFSRFLFFKNGLPFLPRMDEAKDTLTQLRGEAERPKFLAGQNDLPVPPGSFNDSEDYYPVQYSLPPVYGVSPAGLPSQASAQRQAEAKQLRAYLLIYEQLLGNAFSQVANAPKLFSLDPAIDRTYFVKEFSKELIAGYDAITSDLDQARLEGMIETLSEFRERRNRFLDHLMARFGEQFNEYALLLSNLKGKSIASADLINDKISFLKKIPAVSHDRAKAFNYTRQICDPENISGLEKRVSLLLGYPDLSFKMDIADNQPGNFTVKYSLNDSGNKTWFNGSLKVKAADKTSAKGIATRRILNQMINPEGYYLYEKKEKFILTLKKVTGVRKISEKHPAPFDTIAPARELKNTFLGWSANSRAIVVEHLLLRPKFPGDALYPACSEGPCKTCGDEDPYSFRLTWVMPGWTDPFNTNLDMRRFAERTIRAELPSHLLGKICWVSNDGFIENPCDPVITQLADLIMNKGLTKAGKKPTGDEACNCALSVYSLFAKAFDDWYSGKTLDYLHADALYKILADVFSNLKAEECSCSAIDNVNDLWGGLTNLMILHFKDIALYGWQFERFEDAWCRWLKENALFDWTAEHLQEHVEAMLTANLVSAPVSKTTDLCAVSCGLINSFGVSFYNWMNQNFGEGRDLKDFTPFLPPAVILPPGVTFNPGTEKVIFEFLSKRYNSYINVSYALWKVVNLLGKLKNSYPGATLHDCDDGSDHNPLRLGSTALGNYPEKQNVIQP